jgi:HEAT repeat protein
MTKLTLAVLLLGGLAAVSAMAEEPPATDTLLARRDPEALAELERRFTTSDDQIERQKIASVLVRRLERDQPYFDFLADKARQAVKSTMPFPFAVDLEGKAVRGQYSSEFLRWASEQRIPPDSAAAYAMNEAPLDVLALALADDPRSADLLLEAVASPNYMVAYQGAVGLARLRAEAAVPRIVEAAEAAPAELGGLLARALILFDAPMAQAAATRLIGDEKLVAAIRMNARQQLEMNIGEP